MKKWKLWVGWHGSSCWLLCLCVLCFVFYAAFKTIQCSWVSPYFILKKMKIMSYVFWQVSLLIKLRQEKITTGKKGTVIWPSVGINLRLTLSRLQNNPQIWGNFFSSCAVVSVFYSGRKYVLVLHTTYVLRVPYSCSVVLVFLVLAGNGFWC